MLSVMVRMGGFEPPQPYGHMALNHARLPVPPHSQSGGEWRIRTIDPLHVKQVLSHWANPPQLQKQFYINEGCKSRLRKGLFQSFGSLF